MLLLELIPLVAFTAAIGHWRAKPSRQALANPTLSGLGIKQSFVPLDSRTSDLNGSGYWLSEILSTDGAACRGLDACQKCVAEDSALLRQCGTTGRKSNRCDVR